MSSFAEIKKQEAKSRMQDIREAKKSRRAALKIQQRNSLVCDWSKCRITNLREVGNAMAKWV
jgi:hypothetical protein